MKDRVFVQFTIVGKGKDVQAIALDVMISGVVQDVEEMENLYVHDGAGLAWQQNRRCHICGGHVWRDVLPGEEVPPVTPNTRKLACVKCGRQVDVQ